MEDDRARRRVSVDCTPPQIEYRHFPERRTIIRDQIVVPLILATKHQFTSLDLRDAAGSSLPLVGREENATYASLSLCVLLHAALNRPPTPIEMSYLYAICAVSSEKAEAIADRLRRRLARELETVPAEVRLFIDHWLNELCKSFLVLAVIPSETAAKRQVFKLSYDRTLSQTTTSAIDPRPSPANPAVPVAFDAGHPRTFSASTSRVRLALRNFRERYPYMDAGVGRHPLVIDFFVEGADRTRSFHFEIPLPPELSCAKVSFLTADGKPLRTIPSLSPVVHARLRNPEDASSMHKARLELMLKPSNLQICTKLGTLMATIFLLGAAMIPNALANLREKCEATTALLLFGPALWLALTLRGTENTLTGQILRPHRSVAWMLAFVLALASLSLTGHLYDRITPYAWIMLSCFTLKLFAYVNPGVLRCFARLFGRRAYSSKDEGRTIEA